MKNEFKNKIVSALVLLVVAISCGGILQYLWTKSKKNENAPVVEVAAQDPEFDPDEQDTEDMIYVGTFRLESPEEFVETPVARIVDRRDVWKSSRGRRCRSAATFSCCLF